MSEEKLSTKDYIMSQDIGIGVHIQQPQHKSKMEINGLTINLFRKFNWIQRLMWKIWFGAKVTNIKEEETEL